MVEERGIQGAVSYRDGVGQAWHAIRANRLRSLLLILGVSIGVTTLLAIFTIVTGLSGRIRDDIVSANQPYIYISRDSGIGGGDREEIMRREHLMPELLGPIHATEGVDQVDYQLSNGSGESLKYGQEKAHFVQTFGSAQTFPYIFSINVAEGRFFTDNEVNSRARVAVLGYGPAQDLFPYLDPKIGRAHV